MSQGLKAIVFGATGGVGRVLIPQLVASPRWSKVIGVARKEAKEWKELKQKYNHNQNGQKKFQVQIQKDMDRLFKTQQWKYQGFDVIFSLFGSQVKHGQQIFTKIDKTYPLLCQKIAKANNIPHFLIVTSLTSNPSSPFLLMRTKGQLQLQLKHQNSLQTSQKLTILRPGIIANRPDQRFQEKVAKRIAFFYPQIQCQDLGTALMGLAEREAAERQKEKSQLKEGVRKGNVEILENKEILDFVQKYKKGKKIDK